MYRRAGLAPAGVLALATALGMAACGRGGTAEGDSRAAPEAQVAAAASPTTPPTRPVVTVYKSPT